jgi:hypothetical protein
VRTPSFSFLSDQNYPWGTPLKSPSPLSKVPFWDALAFWLSSSLIEIELTLHVDMDPVRTLSSPSLASSPELKRKSHRWAWWWLPVIPALRGPKQEDHKFQGLSISKYT